MAWLIAIVCAVLALWVLALYRRARQDVEVFRAEAKRRIRELASLGYDENRVGRRLAAVGEASREAVFICKADRTVIYLNPVAEALFGKPPGAGLSLIAVTRHYELDRLAADVLAAPQANPDDLSRQCAIDGRIFRARAAVFEGGLALCLADVSELQRLGRARRDLIANLSHELRTPLTSIRLLLESLQSGAVHSPEEATGLLQKVDVEVESLQQMAQELLDLAQIESGQALVRLEPTPVADLVGGVVERFAPQAARKQQAVSAEVPPDLVALADAEQVSRALGNLLHNAIKFTPPGGQIRVSARPLEGDVLIEVADAGPGIPADDLPRVFERFFRGDRARAGGGTGLGLAIAKHVVEAHGGRIWAESDGVPGKGATFHFSLPKA